MSQVMAYRVPARKYLHRCVGHESGCRLLAGQHSTALLIQGLHALPRQERHDCLRDLKTDGWGPKIGNIFELIPRAAQDLRVKAVAARPDLRPGVALMQESQ
jgi:hypothetical protein